MSLQSTRRNPAAFRTLDGVRRASRRTRLRPTAIAGLAAASFWVPNAAAARPAQCFTSDDGYYACDFVAGPRGGFTISASGKPTVTLDTDAPGIAFGFAELDGRNVALPGRYRRSEPDRACWENDATGARICAWSRP